MENLDLNKIDFTGARKLSIEEMKKVMGGIISPETLLGMCAEGVYQDMASVEDPVVRELIFQTGADTCMDIYGGMIKPYVAPGHYS
ncbi:MAG: hypothetical protein EOO96_00290 [Pedobacter sp.]|nr:MAG: hypothetical protein EOO96_00290 [Pedobacter sp.]